MGGKNLTVNDSRTPPRSNPDVVKKNVQYEIRQLEGLHQISLEILERVQPDKIIERALELIFPLVESDGAAFWQRISDKDQTWNELSVSVGKPGVPVGTRFETGKGMIGEVFESGKTVLIADFLAPEYENYPIRTSRSLMFVPLIRDQLVTGVFVIGHASKVAAFDQNDLALLMRFATLVSVALENARLFQQARELTGSAVARSQQLEALHALSLEIVSENDPTLVIKRAMTLATTLVGAGIGGYWRAQRPWQPLEEPYLELILATPNVARFIGRQMSLTETSLVGHVLKTGRAERVADYINSSYRHSEFQESWRSVTAVPLWHKNQIDGVFVLINSQQVDFFDAYHVEILESFASLCAVALENASLLSHSREVESQSRRRAQILGVMHEFSLELIGEHSSTQLLERILTRATELIQVDASALYLLEDSVLKLAARSGIQIPTELQLGHGVLGRVAQSGQAFLVNDYKSSSHRLEGATWNALMAVPLSHNGTVLGVLALAMNEPSGTFSDADLDTLERFAALASVALENARLFKAVKTAQLESQSSRLEAHRRAQQLEAVYQTSLELSGHLEPDAVLTVLVERVATLFLANTGAVYFRVPGTDKIELRANFGTSPTPVGTVDQGLSGRVISSGQSMTVPDYRTWAGRDPEITTPHMWRSAMSAPITRGNQVIGALSIVDTRFSDRFSKTDLEVLERFATFASVAFENARLHEIERQNLREERIRSQIAIRLSPLRSIPELCDAVLEELDGALGFKHCSMFLLRDGLLMLQAKRGFENTIKHFSLDQGIVGRAVRTRQNQIVLDPKNDPDYFKPEPNPNPLVCLPIYSGNRDLGAINFGLEPQQTPNPADLEMLESLMPTISASLENAVLHAELEARATELEVLSKKAEQAASHDPLTGLANRRALERELGAARVENAIFTLAAFDLTGFKSVNDQLGHDAGDDALKRIANVLNQVLEPLQSQPGMKGAFRVGGDEFFLLIPKPSNAALELCRTVIERIGALEFPKNLRVSTNIGLAEYPSEAVTIDALFSLADTRMYAAKRVGKPFLHGTELERPPEPKRRKSDTNRRPR
jgi:diguanylate cyclase (GGDEF)-like protein